MGKSGFQPWGDTIATYNLILEQYFQKQKKTDQGELFGLSFRDGATFNCWRGYHAIYKIYKDSLFLVDIITCGELRNTKIDTAASARKIKSIFNSKFADGKVFIDWFSGDISFPLNNKAPSHGARYCQKNQIKLQLFFK